MCKAFNILTRTGDTSTGKTADQPPQPLAPAPGPSLTRPQHVASKPRFTVRLLSVALALCLCCPCESCLLPHGLGFVCRSTRPCDMFVYTLSTSLRDHVSQMMLFLCLICFRKLVDQSPGRLVSQMMICVYAYSFIFSPCPNRPRSRRCRPLHLLCCLRPHGLGFV